MAATAPSGKSDSLGASVSSPSSPPPRQRGGPRCLFQVSVRKLLFSSAVAIAAFLFGMALGVHLPGFNASLFATTTTATSAIASPTTDTSLQPPSPQPSGVAAAPTTVATTTSTAKLNSAVTTGTAEGEEQGENDDVNNHTTSINPSESPALKVEPEAGKEEEKKTNRILAPTKKTPKNPHNNTHPQKRKVSKLAKEKQRSEATTKKEEGGKGDDEGEASTASSYMTFLQFTLIATLTQLSLLVKITNKCEEILIHNREAEEEADVDKRNSHSSGGQKNPQQSLSRREKEQRRMNNSSAKTPQIAAATECYPVEEKEEEEHKKKSMARTTTASDSPSQGRVATADEAEVVFVTTGPTVVIAAHLICWGAMVGMVAELLLELGLRLLY